MERLPYGKYTKEFRQEAVKLVIDDGLSVHDAAEEANAGFYDRKQLGQGV
jgi:transposase-like protein